LKNIPVLIPVKYIVARVKLTGELKRLSTSSEQVGNECLLTR